MEGVAERNEDCNVCVCILLLWSPISPTWRRLLTEMRIAMPVCVYYSLGHVFPQTWRGLLTDMRIAMYVYVWNSLENLFPQHGWVAHRNGDCNVCMCILFPWSPISPTWRGLLTEMRIAMFVCVYYSLGFSPNMEGDFQRNENCTVCTCILFPWSPISPQRMCSSQKWELQCLYVYIIPINTNFPKHGVGCSHKWDLQCLYVYIIPLITYFPEREGFAERNENCNVCVCVLFLWSPISPTWWGLLREMRNAMCMCILFPWSRISPNMEGVAHRNKNCNVCVYILFLWSPISPTWRGLLT